MKSKTKIGFILIGLGALISLIFIVLSWYMIIDFLFSVFGLTTGFLLIGIGWHMVKIRFNRWMDED